MTLVDTLVAHWAGTCPNKCAIVDRNQRFSYADLIARAEEQARRLAAVGVGHGDRVAVIMDRSADLVTMELACLQLGAAYVPIPPLQPAERTRLMLDDCGAQAIVRAAMPGLPLIEPRPLGTTFRRFVESSRSGDDLAYVMYTSGSTGAPKGVAVPHRAIVSLVSVRDYATIGPDDVVAFASNPAFDASTWEVWGALANGAKVVVLNRDTVVAPSRLAEAIRDHGITAMFLTTALFNHIVRTTPSALGGLRTLLFGGEACDASIVQRAYSAMVVKRLVHVYGPTECTTFALFHEVGTRSPEDVTEGGATVPIGRPIAGTTAHVLDPGGSPVADGMEGELYLGGNRLAIGYITDNSLTRQRFVPDHLEPGGNRRLYRTGDLVVRRPNGDLDYLGRTDRQVKVRGFRVQLEEVERAATRHPAVRRAVASARPGADGVELALVVESDGIDEPSIRRHIGLHLPLELLPARITVVSTMPLTENGKIDRSALERSEAAADPGQAPPAPETADIDPAVVAAWQRALASTIVDPDASFFDLGGSSLQAARMLAELHATTGVDLPLSAVFEYPTLRMLAAAVAGKPGGAAATARPAFTELRPGSEPVVVVVDCYEGTAFTFRPLLQRLQFCRAVVALNAMRVAGRRQFGESVAQIAAACIKECDRAGIATTSPVFVGYSAGGAVAFEMARQLLERGATIGGVVLLDPASAIPMHASRPAKLKARQLFASPNRFRRVWRAGRGHLSRYFRNRRDEFCLLYERLAAGKSIEAQRQLNFARQRVLMASYWPQPLPSELPVLFIACTGGRSEQMLQRYMGGWRPLFDKAAQMHCVSGRHTNEDSFLKEPHVAEVARLMEKFFEGVS